MPKAMADRAIDIAVKKAEENGIKGKQLTPFLLALVKEMTGGMSLDSNIQLVYNNARVAAKTAVALSALEAQDKAAEDEEENLDMLRAEIADDTAESISREIASFRSEMETLISQRMAAAPMPAFMNPYMNPYQQMPYQQQNPYAAQQPASNPYQQNPYQPAPNPYQPPYQPMPEQFQQQPYQPASAQPYVNPYKPVRPAVQPEPEPAPAPAPAYKAVPDDQWVNPFAPKREKAPEPAPEPASEPMAVGGDAPASNVIARTSDEVMAMVEETVEKPEEAANEAVEAGKDLHLWQHRRYPCRNLFSICSSRRAGKTRSGRVHFAL